MPCRQLLRASVTGQLICSVREVERLQAAGTIGRGLDASSETEGCGCFNVALAVIAEGFAIIPRSWRWHCWRSALPVSPSAVELRRIALHQQRAPSHSHLCGGALLLCLPNQQDRCVMAYAGDMCPGKVCAGSR